MQSDGTELSEAIAAVRAGLADARSMGAGSEVKFIPEEVTLDFSIELRRGKKRGGTVKAYVLSGEAGSESAGTDAQRITIRLRVVDDDGKELPVGDQVSAEDLRRPDGR